MTLSDKIHIRNGSEDELSSVNSEPGNSDNSVNEENDNDLANANWADAISKILKQKSKKKTIVLSKAKKITDVKKKSKLIDFEIEGSDGIIKPKDEDSSEESKDDKLEVTETAKKKKKEILNLRLKPDILDRDRERLLQKIATKGVVQLFNAVRSQQKDITKKLEAAGPLEVRKEKVLKNIDKRSFLNVLMGEKSHTLDTSIEKNGKQVSTVKDDTWSVLKEDFMMGAKMKDWDKELENDVESS